MDPGLCSIPSAASNEQGISTQRADDQGISTHGADCEGMTTQDAHDPGMTTHTANVQGMTTHKMDAINVTTLSEIQQNIIAMTKVMQQMAEAWTSLADQPSKRHYSDSDTDDEMPSKAKKMTAVPPTSNLDDLGACLSHNLVMLVGMWIYLMSWMTLSPLLRKQDHQFMLNLLGRCLTGF